MGVVGLIMVVIKALLPVCDFGGGGGGDSPLIKKIRLISLSYVACKLFLF